MLLLSRAVRARTGLLSAGSKCVFTFVSLFASFFRQFWRCIVKSNLKLDRHDAAAAAAGAEADAAGRRSQIACSAPGCRQQLREDGAPLDVFVKCRCTHYCSKACQTIDWKREGGHKAECKALIAEGKGEAPLVL